MTLEEDCLASVAFLQDTDGEVLVFTEHMTASKVWAMPDPLCGLFWVPCVPGPHDWSVAGLTSDLYPRASLLPWGSADSETHMVPTHGHLGRPVRLLVIGHS